MFREFRRFAFCPFLNGLDGRNRGHLLRSPYVAGKRLRHRPGQADGRRRQQGTPGQGEPRVRNVVKKFFALPVSLSRRLRRAAASAGPWPPLARQAHSDSPDAAYCRVRDISQARSVNGDRDIYDRHISDCERVSKPHLDFRLLSVSSHFPADRHQAARCGGRPGPPVARVATGRAARPAAAQARYGRGSGHQPEWPGPPGYPGYVPRSSRVYFNNYSEQPAGRLRRPGPDRVQDH
jgi:hypothetical protein